jgi:putative flippase GtrA
MRWPRPSSIDAMSDRTQRLIAEVGRFLAVGGAATIVALIIFNLLLHGFNTGDHAMLAQQPILAYVVANSVGMGVSYYGSRNWAFRDRPPVTSDGGLTSFIGINFLTMLIPIGCLAFSRDVLGLDDPFSDNLAANGIGLVLGLSARFALFRTFVFKRPISIMEIYDEPGLVDGVEFLDGDSGSVNESAALARGRSTSGPVPPAALGPGGD